MMRPRHLMKCYQKVTIIYSCKKYSKIDDWILQINRWSFGSHNEISFTKRIPKYNFRSCRVTLLSNPRTNQYSIDTVAYKAAQLWNTLPTTYKTLSSLDFFKSKIKNWHCSDCHCNICQIFVDGVGFINCG